MLTIEEFGDQIIRSGDLDPVYIACTGVQGPQLDRLLIAYWCFYHLGVAAWMSEHKGEDFWTWMRSAAVNMRLEWPRASERRHFRGRKCIEAVEWLARREPEHWAGSLRPLGTDAAIMKEVQSWPMFGPWIAFKAADMIERVAGEPVAFNSDIGLMYREPRAALDILVGDSSTDRARDEYHRLLHHFRDYAAPPGCDRPCGPQEVETVLCKWKSYRGGHYHPGKDLKEVAHALGWVAPGHSGGRGKAAKMMQATLQGWSHNPAPRHAEAVS